MSTKVRYEVLELGGQMSGSETLPGKFWGLVPFICHWPGSGEVRSSTPYYALGFSVWLPLQTSTFYGTQRWNSSLLG